MILRPEDGCFDLLQPGPVGVAGVLGQPRLPGLMAFGSCYHRSILSGLYGSPLLNHIPGLLTFLGSLKVST